MDISHGLLGFLGFLVYEVSWLLSVKKLEHEKAKDLVLDRRYFLLIGLFGFAVIFFVSIIGPGDLSAGLFPPIFSNPNLADAARSIGLGFACLFIYKSGKHQDTTGKAPVFQSPEGGSPGPRAETTRLSPDPSLSFRQFLRFWKTGAR